MSAKPHGHEADWPDPVEVLNEEGSSDIVLLCEHASNHMPVEFGGLGLDAPHLDRHIAWDIGAAAVTRGLAALLDAPAFLGTYSRLLVDLNRPLGSEGSMPVRSEGTEIPGNIGLDAAERARRAALMFTPYHDKVAAHLDRRAAKGLPTRIVTIHSFTPVFLGVTRPWHAGVLYGDAESFGQALLAGLRDDPALNIEANQPYVVSRDADYALPIHGEDRGIAAVLIEVRQDLLADPAGIEAWTKRLAVALAVSTKETVR